MIAFNCSGIINNRMIASGTYGSVHETELDNGPVAVKVHHSDHLTAYDPNFLFEVSHVTTLARTLPPNVPLVLPKFVIVDSACTVMPLYEQTLYDAIPSKGLAPYQVSQIFRQVLEGIALMHERGFAHGDIDPRNILIDTNGNAAIADFSLVSSSSFAFLDEDDVPLYRRNNNFHKIVYRAPELFSRKKTRRYFPADVWAIGACMFNALYGFLLVQITSTVSRKVITDLVDKQITRAQKSNVHPQALDLLKLMLDPNPESRITAIAALRHPFISPSGKLPRHIIEPTPMALLKAWARPDVPDGSSPFAKRPGTNVRMIQNQMLELFKSTFDLQIETPYRIRECLFALARDDGFNYRICRPLIDHLDGMFEFDDSQPVTRPEQHAIVKRLRGQVYRLTILDAATLFAKDDGMRSGGSLAMMCCAACIHRDFYPRSALVLGAAISAFLSVTGPMHIYDAFLKLVGKRDRRRWTVKRLMELGKWIAKRAQQMRTLVAKQ